jgi:hypothetical protein
MTTVTLDESVLTQLEGVRRMSRKAVLNFVLVWPTFEEVRGVAEASPEASVSLTWVIGYAFEKVIHEDGIIRMVEVLQTEQVVLTNVQLWTPTTRPDGFYIFCGEFEGVGYKIYVDPSHTHYYRSNSDC